MVKLPQEIKTHLTSKEVLSIKKWWSGLNHSKQLEIAQLYQTDKKQAVTIRFCARHIGEPEEPSENEIWVEELTDLYEYLVGHEIWDNDRQFHAGGTCKRDPIAKTIIESGVLKKDFTCPLNLDDCQMKGLLKYFCGQDVKFFLIFKREG